MEISVSKEDLSEVDCGGGYRTVSAKISIDVSKSARLQRHAVVYEVLASYLEPMFARCFVLELADSVCNGLDDIE